MPIEFAMSRQVPDDAEAIGVPVYADRLEGPDPGIDWAFLAQQGFEGKVGETQVMPGAGGVPLVAVGVGKRADVDNEVLRRSSASLARATRRQGHVAASLLDAVPEGFDRARAAQAVAEGVALASYRFNRYKSDPKPSRLTRFTLVGAGGAKVHAGLERGARIAEAVALARDLVNEPGGTLTPRALAEAAVEVAEREDLGITILDEVDIEAAGLGGLLGVNRGSSEPPRFIEITYEPENPRATVALVGKGITFDSGGLSIKTADGMETMKTDMSGAAAVLGVMSAVRDLAPRVRVLGFIPSTDNMSGGDATRPGDVLKIRNGKTVEVLNTDAEGRLILADALSLAVEQEPDGIIDLATLTGACVVALGNKVAGLFGNHDGLIEQVRAAGERTGERAWPMPLPDDYRKLIDSDVADIKNTAGRGGGAITAALFLREFVDKVPWVHLDIAGTARSGEEDGYVGKGGTGFGVRLVLETLASFTKPSRRR